MKTLNDTIAELEALRQIHGGEIEVVSSKGPVSFRAITWTEKEKFYLDVNDTIVLETAERELL